MDSFPAIIASEKGAPATLGEVPESALPEGDVTVDVHWSSLNYKDGLAVTGRGPVIRSFPMVCGIDLAGTVHDSDSADWSPGDEVVVTGWGLSETHPGGYTTRQRVRAQWLQGRPEGLSLRDTMAIGTGGLTAMLCLMALEEVGARAAFVRINAVPLAKGTEIMDPRGHCEKVSVKQRAKNRRVPYERQA